MAKDTTPAGLSSEEASSETPAESIPEYIETLVTIVADKVIGGHTHILMESAFGGERADSNIKEWAESQFWLIHWFVQLPASKQSEAGQVGYGRGHTSWFGRQSFVIRHSARPES